MPRYFGTAKITRVQDALFTLTVGEEMVLIPVQSSKLQLICHEACQYKATYLQLSGRFESGQSSKTLGKSLGKFMVFGR